MNRILLALTLIGCNEYGIGPLTDITVQGSTTSGTLSPDQEATTGAITGSFCIDGVPSVGAQVWVVVDGVLILTHTDLDGSFTLYAVPPGEMVLHVLSDDGTLDGHIPVVVHAGATTELPLYECPPPVDDGTTPEDPEGPGIATGGDLDTGAPVTSPDPSGDEGGPGSPDRGSPDVPGDTGAPGLPGLDTGPGEDLCRTIGYWKNHPEDWPLTDVTVGSETFPIVDALAILGEDPNGDASLILARQVIATKLNLSIGGPVDIVSVVADADAWLATWNPGTGLAFLIPTASVEGAEATLLAGLLDDYNNQTCW